MFAWILILLPHRAARKDSEVKYNFRQMPAWLVRKRARPFSYEELFELNDWDEARLNFDEILGDTAELEAFERSKRRGFARHRGRNVP